MKESGNHLTLAGYARRASVLVLLASALIVVLGLLPAPASAITRTTVISRAHSWVSKGIIYSQSRTYRGYRRDCSGFVSMAWRLKRSYTSRTIHRVAKRIRITNLRPGDAIRTPGHVAIFVKWKSKSRRTYYAMEESRWGRPALHRVKTLRRGAVALRYRRITETPRIIAAVTPPIAPAVAPPIDTLPVVTVAAASVPTYVSSTVASAIAPITIGALAR